MADCGLLCLHVALIALVWFKDELSGETFDMLNTVWEFLEFKDLMLSYKRSRTTSSAVAAPTSEGLSISGSGRSAPSAGLDLSITGKHL
eukprot:scaffold732_cov192-Ochromonas_danica.AAC.3